ncbi:MULTISPECIES: zinc-binding dehydrogenase [unclassified Streptomyces]|uniref:quinone oxidoreductase family protein n=1 Tax=unclassified Streptomyces TaxID=2593676 RepID=UPI00336AC944
MRAVHIKNFGGPEVLELVELPDPRPAEGELLVDVTLAGINYRDTHQSEVGALPGDALPLIPGMEVVGTAPDGRRVAAVVPRGGYAERVVVPQGLAVDIPDAVDDFSALALLVQGTTAWLLLHESARLREGESVLVHAAAGGVGSLAVQLAKAAGAGRVIAAAGTEAKRALALDLGADAVIDSTAPGLAAAAREANGGRGLDIVLEMTGGHITDESLTALAPLGRLVFYGMASRKPPKPVELPALMQSSATVCGLTLEGAMSRPGLLERAMRELFDEVARGGLRVISGGVRPLSEVRQAHEDLSARRTVGKLALDPRR